MLDTTTKKRIDDCRDILVGKLPDPKAQIEQITIALIYKFMDDMDKEAIDLGGKAKFFTDYTIPDPEDPKKKKTVPFSQYSWDNLFNTKVTAAEMLRLYSEAIAGMDKNPNIPQLFRDIFKNAFLPYRDPETLKLFLKTIGEFEYTHSEKLGDAFEYLLSVMGSQGDAGQFRTPRHIIDFVTAIVNPGKTDKILDPACGTAGFLISAFKHIKEQSKKGLTPDEQRKMIQNFVGYDISPDMVRLSLVNLYLHGFSDPHIWEYDTLSSEERWDESFDVVLANPPFMSPKGGIRPHKKFSISSNRSEVLFVDYIAEHLGPKGRAGIIVPEGVIFQSGTAYKELRKMLVENYLYAVVSLPAGVFNPYSGVKTSVLLMDKALAKKKEDILFVKIENDGYSLGAQRNEIKGGQLEEAVELLQQYREGNFAGSEWAHAVSKEEIAKNGDYNLSGERYKSHRPINSDFPIVELKNVAEVIAGQSPKGEFYNESGQGLAFYQGKTEFGERYIGAPTKWTTEITKEAFKDDILMSVRAPVGPVNYAIQHCCIGRGLAAIKSKEQIKNDYLFYLLKSLEKDIKGNGGAVFDSISKNQIEEIKIPLPPLSIQQEIVAEIEGWQKIIDGAKAVVENYKPKIDIDADWEIVELGEVCKIKGGNAFKSEDYVEDGVQLIRMGNVKQMFFDVKNSPSYLPKEYLKEHSNYILGKGDLLVSMTGTIGKEDYGNVCQIDIDEKYLLNQRVGKFEITNKNLNKQFLYYVANTENFRKQLFSNSSGGVRQSNISNKGIESILIPFPPIETQHQIVAQIEKEQALVNANKELITIFEQKIKDRIAKVWGSDKKEGKLYEENEMVTMAAEGESKM